MKKITPTFTGSMKDGKPIFTMAVREAMKRWFLTFKTGTQVDIIIRKHNSKRTNQQNAYYWGVVLPILADHFGYDEPDDVHTAMKLMFNPVKCKITGKIIGGTTTTMSTEEFFSNEKSFVNRISRWAAMEHQIFIPEPNGVE